MAVNLHKHGSPVLNVEEENGDVFPVTEPLLGYVWVLGKEKNCALADIHSVAWTNVGTLRLVEKSDPFISVTFVLKGEVFPKIPVWPKCRCWTLLFWTTRVRLEIRFSLKLHLSAWRTCQKVGVVFVVCVLYVMIIYHDYCCELTMCRKKSTSCYFESFKVYCTVSIIGFLISYFQVVKNWRWRDLGVLPAHSCWLVRCGSSETISRCWLVYQPDVTTDGETARHTFSTLMLIRISTFIHPHLKFCS